MPAITLNFREDGAVSSLCVDGVEFVDTPRPLFVFQLRDKIGNPLRFSSSIFKKVNFEEQGNRTILRFSGDERFLRSGSALVTLERSAEELRWGISMEINDDLVELEWIDFPVVHLQVAQDFRYLTTYAEGMYIGPEGLDCFQRLLGREIGSDYIGYTPCMIRYFYPGPVSAQFHAVLRGDCGLYVGYEDLNDSLKLLEVRPEDDGSCTLLQQQFTGGKNFLDYQVVMRGFRGGWRQAAEIQREWLESTGRLPSKLQGNMPAWFDRDPLMVIYPVKGEGLDHYEMGPNSTYYPYIKGMDVVNRYHKLLPGNSLMPLLMHWEGTAPWAPPFVWPPYGGAEELQKFTDALHAQGDFIGLYASGIGWTQYSAVDHSYNCCKRFVEEGVEKEICIGPKQEKASSICNHALAGQRIGYDLCPSREYTRNVVKGEVASCQNHGIDYLQYFDQNCGGSAAPCYSKGHGHPHLPGPWMAKAMRQVMDGAVEAGKDTLAIGCENTSALPFMEACRLNDVRYFNTWINGEPVPLYAYLFHEYALGFSGNMCGVAWYCDCEKAPYFLEFHFAWHFAYGNLLSLVTNKEGDIHWGWGCPWDTKAPDQSVVLKLLTNLLAWRKTAAKEYLLYGRMEASPEVVCDTMPFYRKEVPGVVQKPAVLCATWRRGENFLTLLVNYTQKPQEARVHFGTPLQNAQLHETAKEPQALQGDDFNFTVPALDAILIYHTQPCQK